MNTNRNAKRILIYGDSYTYGFFLGKKRLDSDKRYTGVIQDILGYNYEIIEEGLRGRTLSGENAFFPQRNGLVQFDGIIGSHLPLDLVVFFLGTNDINSGSSHIINEIVNSYIKYFEKLEWWCNFHGYTKPEVLIVGPPVINEAESYKIFNDIFKNSQKKSESLSMALKNFTTKHQVKFFDASQIVFASISDGIHLDEESHEKLGRSLALQIRRIVE